MDRAAQGDTPLGFAAAVVEANLNGRSPSYSRLPSDAVAASSIGVSIALYLAELALRELARRCREADGKRFKRLADEEKASTWGRVYEVTKSVVWQSYPWYRRMLDWGRHLRSTSDHEAQELAHAILRGGQELSEFDIQSALDQVRSGR